MDVRAWPRAGVLEPGEDVGHDSVNLGTTDAAIPSQPRIELAAPHQDLAAGIVAYAVSPIDLIPDFIPILGYLDDLVLLPLGVLLIRRMVPEAVMADCRLRAEAAFRQGKPVSRVGAAIVIALWFVLAVGGIALAGRLLWLAN